MRHRQGEGCQSGGGGRKGRDTCIGYVWRCRGPLPVDFSCHSGPRAILNSTLKHLILSALYSGRKYFRGGLVIQDSTLVCSRYCDRSCSCQANLPTIESPPFKLDKCPSSIKACLDNSHPPPSRAGEGCKCKR